MLTFEYTGTESLSVEQVVALEQELAAQGTPLLQLMQRAGAVLAQVVEDLSPYDDVAVFAGTGNNGGDGWVAARLLGAQGARRDQGARSDQDACRAQDACRSRDANRAQRARRVVLITPCAAEELTAEPARTAALECMQALRTGESVVELLIDPSPAQVAQVLADSDIVVDAMLGTGFSHTQIREPLATWIALINDASETGITTVAADCPSGLNAQTGAHADRIVTADYTVTMLAVKTGLLAACAAPYVGKLLLAPLVDGPLPA